MNEIRHQMSLRHAIKVGHWESNCGNCGVSVIGGDPKNCERCGWAFDYYTTDYIGEEEIAGKVFPNLKYLPMYQLRTSGEQR